MCPTIHPLPVHFELLRVLAIFAVVGCGLAWPIALRLPLAAAEKIAASVALSLLGALSLSLATFSVSMKRGVRALEQLG